MHGLIRVAALAALSIIVSAAVHAYGLGKARDARLGATSEDAAAYLLALQLGSGGWAWQEGGGEQGNNFGGIVGESLLAAYEQTADKAYLQAAERYAEVLVGRYRAAPESLPYKPDIEFLVRATEVSGEARYAEVARRWFAVLRDRSPTGRSEVARILRGRARFPNIVGYDVALGIRAALAVEAYDYARALADAVLARRGQWLTKPSGAYGTVSRAALLDALVMTDPQRYSSAIAELSAALLRQQGAQGDWCAGETQATAYAIRGLASLADPAAQAAAKRGAAWLTQTMLERGAWVARADASSRRFEGDVISEVQAEALTAVILAGHI